MGKLTSSENSLNQHIKLKHNEFISKRKYSGEKNDNIYCEDRDDIHDDHRLKDDELINFKNTDDFSHDNQEIDFGKIVENLWIE